MTTSRARTKPSPDVPRWLVRTIWAAHRAILRLTGARWGLRPPTADNWGTLRLTTTGRRSGRRRVAVLGYLEDGPALLVPAMNGWADPEPAWLLNVQSNPDATVRLPDGTEHAVRARVAPEAERPALWARFVELGTSAYSDPNAAKRSRPTAIVILEPVAR